MTVAACMRLLCRIFVVDVLKYAHVGKYCPQEYRIFVHKFCHNHSIIIIWWCFLNLHGCLAKFCQLTDIIIIIVIVFWTTNAMYEVEAFGVHCLSAIKCMFALQGYVHNQCRLYFYARVSFSAIKLVSKFIKCRCLLQCSQKVR